MTVLRDAFGQTSRGVDRGSMRAYTPVDGRAQPGIGFPVDVSTTPVVAIDNQSSPGGNVTRRLSKKLRSKFHLKKKALLPPSGGGTPRPESTIVAPTLAPTPPDTSEKDRFSKLPPEKPDLPPLKDFVKSPLQTARTIAEAQGGDDFAQNLTTAAATHEASVKVVRAYEKIADTATDANEDHARKDLELLKKARQDAFVRWTLDRHVHKVGTLKAPPVSLRPRKDFMVVDQHGRKVTQWDKYGNHILLYHLEQYGGQYLDASSYPPDPSRSALTAGMERFLLTSAPLQDLFMQLRRVAHWKNPPESAAYMTTYFVLLHYNLIVSAALLLAFMLILQRGYYPPTIPDMREDLERSEDRDATPSDLAQFIEQYGGHGWVEKLIEQVGPAMQMQIEDVADVLEMLLNFYEWRDPTRTAFSLSVIGMGWLTVTFVPLWLIVKISFFAIGVMFFGLMPISYRYPKYRRLTSPFIWTFWKVPTHAEWAIARLQAEATQKLAALCHGENLPTTEWVEGTTAPSSESSPSAPANRTMVDEDKSPAASIKIGRYQCTSEKHSGSLCLSTGGVSFETALSQNQRWDIRYEDLQSMQKLEGKGTIRKGDDILFVDVDGRDFQVSGLKDRDVVFSQVIGYSSVRWQRRG